MSHEDATHGPAPMGRVDPEPMHQAVDALAAALHDYVGTAVGVRAEFGAAEADEDPRVLALESKVGHLNAALFDALHGSLGMHPDLTSSVWEPGPEDDVEDVEEPEPEGAEAFYLGFVVAAREGGDASLDGVIDLLDAAGESVATALTDGGYDIAEWAASRGEAPGFGFYEEDDE
ncbi:hypothetical protein ACFQHV_19545 [Promicromonospora thailandica]|uniref:Uncharacterized protein n=1 Tax=Promicromonospora thailandica TaxID=765201 RepID=A0A9X2FX74_9MICO|nr:hypothetical protein [Promicromonospora thailandica]MCP2262975.1 hypothetical protein [Promicromonospora thailandica]BFF18339.1 hypothetical protein GCM10025730_18600 [Promicromonospora thailandica]